MRGIRLMLGGALLAATAALAHHAPAIFDQTKTIVIEGTVTEFVWQNPHSWIRMDVVEPVVDARGERVDIRRDQHVAAVEPGDEARCSGLRQEL